MTLRSLTRLVTRGEGERLEFKRRVPEGPRIAREVVALANAGGGRLLLGVADDGEITGLKYATEEIFAFRHAVKRYCRPPAAYESEKVPLDARSARDRRRDVIVVTVPESPQKPHVLVNAGPPRGNAEGSNAEENSTEEGVAYVRVGEMSVEASPEAVALMEAGDDEPGVTFQYGEKEQLLMRYLEDYTRVTVGQFAKMAGIDEAEASQTLLTLAKADILQIQSDREEDYFTLALKDD
jgi:predicted HTH transcriptional regulator